MEDLPPPLSAAPGTVIAGKYRVERLLGDGAMGVVLRSLLFSREYDLGDRINFFRGTLGSMKLLWPQLLKVNLFESVPELKIPVFIVAGRFDHEVPSEVAARYFEALRAPSKELVWFERSAHMPQFEEPELFTGFMIDKALPLANRSGFPLHGVPGGTSAASSPLRNPGRPAHHGSS